MCVCVCVCGGGFISCGIDVSYLLDLNASSMHLLQLDTLVTK